MSYATIIVICCGVVVNSRHSWNLKFQVIMPSLNNYNWTEMFCCCLYTFNICPFCGNVFVLVIVTGMTKLYRLCFHYNKFIVSTPAICLIYLNIWQSLACFLEGLVWLCAYVLERKAELMMSQFNSRSNKEFFLVQ